jgi:hypothetical protein
MCSRCGSGILQELAVFIEYQCEDTTPSMVEVFYPELLMMLGLTLVIAYDFYNKLKPRLNKAAETEPNTAPGR